MKPILANRSDSTVMEQAHARPSHCNYMLNSRRDQRNHRDLESRLTSSVLVAHNDIFHLKVWSVWGNKAFWQNPKIMEQNEDNIFSHYTPQHPLPEEIKKLARDDTVCKYCGVSYLIHNEIKALEEKLATLEKELTVLRGQEQREALLKKENALLKDQRNDLQSSLETEQALVSTLKVELDNLKGSNKKNEDSATSYKEKYMSTLRKFSALSQVVRQQKQTLHEIREQTMSSQSVILNLIGQMTQNVTLIGQVAKKEHEELQSQVQCLDMEKLVLSQSNTALTASLKTAEEKLLEKETELNSQRELVLKLEKNMQDCDSLGDSLKTLEKSKQDLQKELESLQTCYRASQTELDDCKKQLSCKASELKEATDKMNTVEKNCEISIQKLALELRAKEGEVITSLKQQKTLENKLKEVERREAEGKHSRDISLNETQELRESLQRAKADREALKAERELMIEAHQNRIEELRESFKNKMAEMDNWPQKLQAAVAAEKSKHQSEMKILEENLKHNFVMELQIEKDKYNELLKKFQNQERDKNNMRQTELAQIEQKLKQELEELQRQLAERKLRHQEREEELQGEITSLKKIISDLQDRLARLDSEGSGQMSELKANLAETQQQLTDAHSSIADTQLKLREAQEEAKFLQNIVQKECEERFELTEALSEARRQLLELKRPPGGYSSNGSKRGSVASLGSAHSTTSSQGRVDGPSASQAMPSPAPPSLSNRNSQASNILLSYTNNSSTTKNNSNNGNSSKSNDAQLRESRMRIAQMMGRTS
ncbi:solute carrier family 2, facilitated glucose transporter member 1 [Plakobranchus ocellatus]|uniref:Solute carrier family 2, facilitated glucose transporter member 1 n=1 Tax=Plakobranchus ocellatus TaxID=259542 RepID=A0AAV4BUC8_9GAST|nr:solute carrier family 2, facilitated glucose transporter member 1 [Plakobranchus ocellatus]